MKIFRITVLSMSLVIMAAALIACSKDDKQAKAPEPVIIEPGLATETPDNQPPEEETAPTETPEEPEDLFADLGRASTLDDLMANKGKIESYYFEQNFGYAAGDIHIKTWYKGGIMKVSSSMSGMPETVEFYDCYAYEFITYTPAAGNNAVLMTYEKGDPNVPENPLDYNYHDYRVLETDSIDGQTCRVLEGKNGEKLWIGTQYGFPMQIEFTDPLSDEHFIVTYENIAINQVSDEDVAIPADLIIYEMTGGAGY